MSKPPLWKVMHRAHNDVGDPFGNAARSAYAAEILALRDWLVPEPEEPMFTATDEAFAIWEERKALRALLTTEADRAECGETQP